MSHGMWAAWRSQGNSFSPRTSTKEHSAFILAQGDPRYISDLRNYKMIHMCCLKSVSLWQFVTIAIEN